MQKSGSHLLILISGVMTVLALGTDAGAEILLAAAPESKKCITIGDKRICLEDFTTKKDDADDEGGKPAKTGNICEGEIACPPGYVVLDKPNKYGACCEPKEGFPAPEKTGNICEGEIACPPGYVVLDKPNKYGACCEPKEGFPTPVVWLNFTRDIKGTNVTPESLAVPFKAECATYKESYTNCAIIAGAPNAHIHCVCNYKK